MSPTYGVAAATLASTAVTVLALDICAWSLPPRPLLLLVAVVVAVTVRRLVAASWEGTDVENENEEGEQSMSRRVLAALLGPRLEAPGGGRRGVVSFGGW